VSISGGAYTALVTPFQGGHLDKYGLIALIERQVENGIHGLVPCGTTGEASTLSSEEHLLVVQLTVQTVAGRVTVLAGTGANNTDEAIHLTQCAEKVGADAVLSVTPYYNRPTQEGLYRHYRAIAEATALPIVLYDVPSRTGVNIFPDTVARLAQIDNIVGIKVATGNMAQASETIRLCGENFQVFSGNDSDNLPILALGGSGMISVTSNVVPKEVANLHKNWIAGNISQAQKEHYHLEPLNKAMFLETNPIMVKSALALMGLISSELRLPLCEPADVNFKKLETTLKNMGLIK